MNKTSPKLIWVWVWKSHIRPSIVTTSDRDYRKERRKIPALNDKIKAIGRKYRWKPAVKEHVKILKRERKRDRRRAYEIEKMQSALEVFAKTAADPSPIENINLQAKREAEQKWARILQTTLELWLNPVILLCSWLGKTHFSDWFPGESLDVISKWFVKALSQQCQAKHFKKKQVRITIVDEF